MSSSGLNDYSVFIKSLSMYIKETYNLECPIGIIQTSDPMYELFEKAFCDGFLKKVIAKKDVYYFYPQQLLLDFGDFVRL